MACDTPETLPSKFAIADLQQLSDEVRRRNSRAKYANDSAWRGPFFFVQGADPQFGMFDQWLRKKEDPLSISWEDDKQLMRQAVQDINSLSPQPEFFVVCGDLTHEFDVNFLKLAQERDLLKLLSEIHDTISLVLIPGNHDVLNTPTSSSNAHFVETFGPEYYCYDARGLRCICVNSQYFKSMEEVPPPNFLAMQKQFLDWFDREIARAALDLQSHKIQHAVVFQHIPWFIDNPDEPTDYFNVDYDIRQKYLKLMGEAGIRACFCGHLHKNGGGKVEGGVEVIATSAIGLTLGNDPSGMRLVKITETELSHTFHPLGHMPSKVVL